MGGEKSKILGEDLETDSIHKPYFLHTYSYLFLFMIHMEVVLKEELRQHRG